MITGKDRSDLGCVLVRRDRQSARGMEQITYLLFIRRLDELQTAQENRANRLGTPIDSPIFPLGADDQGRPYEDLRWSRFKDRGPAAMFALGGRTSVPFLEGARWR
jgi:type I restriction enzyme M protein